MINHIILTDGASRMNQQQQRERFLNTCKYDVYSRYQLYIVYRTSLLFRSKIFRVRNFYVKIFSFACNRAPYIV